MRKHRNEMIRFANTEKGTEVWFKHKSRGEWEKEYYPYWIDDTFYVVDDEYAELRKESIDSERKIQVRNSITHKWETPPFEPKFGGGLENYRLEPEEEFKYPIYKKDKNCSLVIKFTGLKDGVVVEGTSIYSVGYKADDWYPHTDTNEWEDIDYKEEPTYYYQWKRDIDIGNIEISNFVTDEYAEKQNYKVEGWVKIENSKRTWED